MAATAGQETAASPARPNIDWAAIRARYPAASRWINLGIASTSLLSDSAREAAQAVIDAKWQGTEQGDADKATLPSVRERFARLIRADADEIAVTKNVTEGVNIVASAIAWQAGDNMVFCPGLEHANNIYAWLSLREKGVEVRAADPRDGAYDTDAIIEAIDERTRLVTTASVTFAPGHRTEMARIGRACRDTGALYLVDGVQSCGILDWDVGRDCIDAVATSTSKGILGLAGLGFLYVRRDLIPELHPAYLGRYSVKRGEGHYSEFEGDTYELLDSAQRFEAGNYNWTGIAATNASLGELLEIGSEAIDAHVTALAQSFAHGLKALGLPVTEPPEGVRRSHIVTVGTLGAGDTETTNDSRLDGIATALKQNDVKFTIRKGLLRFAFHCYNDDSDVARVLAIIEKAG